MVQALVVLGTDIIAGTIEQFGVFQLERVSTERLREEREDMQEGR